jgi:hypothetical protein
MRIAALIPNFHSLLEQGKVFFVSHAAPPTAGMGFIVVGANMAINVHLRSCAKTTSLELSGDD